MIFRHARLNQAALLTGAVALLVSSFFSQRHLNQQRDTLGLTRVTPLENAPPVLAFTTIALGGFRGLIANALWIRASDLQESDKYFEMVQLSDWITKLQPHFTAVWAHQAWNMAYNISIKFKDPKDRWPWVRRGIELLRDQGIHYNPKEPLLYRELAWFFQHKMGQNLDDAHEFYKFAWAEEMQKVLGSGRPNFEELLNPPTPEVAARAQILREKYKLEPRLMKAVDERYGPFEWRLPDAHAIYWAYAGLVECVDGKPEELVQLRRNIFQSMQTAFVRGRMIFPRRGVFEFDYGPNIQIVDKVNQSYEEMIEQEPSLKDNLRNGHKNFLKMAVYVLYNYGETTSAEGWFKNLQEKYPDALLNGEQLELKRRNPDLTFPPKSLEQYAFERVSEEIGDGGVDKTKGVIEGYLTRSFIDRAIGEVGPSAGSRRLAELIWNNYMERIGSKAGVRVGLPPMEEMEEEILRRLLDPNDGLDAVIANQLRTALNLPAAAVGATNGPNATAPQTPNAPDRPPATVPQPR